MVQGKTHYALTKSMYPNMRSDTIVKVNQALDNPTMVTKGLSKLENLLMLVPCRSFRAYMIYWNGNEINRLIELCITLAQVQRESSE